MDAKTVFQFTIQSPEKSKEGLVLTTSGATSLRPATFVYTDDVDQIGDMAVLEFNDSLAFFSEFFPLIGTEKVEVLFGEDPHNGKMIISDMSIFSIEEKKPSIGGSYMTVRMYLVNSKLVDLVGEVHNRSWRKRYSEVAKVIADEAQFKTKIIEDTEGVQPIIQPYWTNAQLLRSMSENSVGTQNKSAPFIFHVRENEFHFHSIEYVYKGDTFKIEDIYTTQYTDPKGSFEEQKKVGRNIIIDAIFRIRNQFFLTTGGRGITGGSVDFSKGYQLKSKTGDEVIRENQQLGGALPARPEEMKSLGRFVYSENDAFLKSAISSSLQNIIEVEIFAKGKAERKSCSLVYLHSPSEAMATLSKYDGLYFVKSVSHIYQEGEYYNKMTLIRSGINKDAENTVNIKNIKKAG